MFILYQFIGGFGNQWFQWAASFAINGEKETSVLISSDTSPGFVSSPTYFPMKQYTSDPPSVKYLGQFDFDESLSSRSRSDNVAVNSMMMNFNYLRDVDLESLRFALEVTKDNASEDTLLIGFRSFKEEQHNEWASNIEYYRKALEEYKSWNGNVIAMTDDSDFTERILDEIGFKYDQLIAGNRSPESVWNQFKLGTQCSHFILCNSSFHLIIAYTSGSINVTYPKDIWLEKTNLPSQWKAI